MGSVAVVGFEAADALRLEQQIGPTVRIEFFDAREPLLAALRGGAVFRALLLGPGVAEVGELAGQLREVAPEAAVVLAGAGDAVSRLAPLCGRPARPVPEGGDRVIFENAAAGVAVVGLDGRWLEANPRMCEMLGYPREELLAKTFQDITHPEDLATDLEQARRLVAGEIDHYSLEKRYIRKGGSVMWASLRIAAVRGPSGEADYVVGVIEDITARRMAERAREEATARLQAVMDATVDSIVTIDERGIIESVNPATQRLFGYAPEEMIGRNVSMLMPEPHRSLHDQYIRRYLDTNEARIIGRGREVVGLRKDGARFPLDLAVGETFVSGRRIFTGIMRDITVRKRAEQELRALNETLEEKVAQRAAEAEHRAKQLQALTVQLTEAEEQERRRLAQLLHDHLQQMLVAAKMNVTSLHGQLDSDRQPLLDPVKKLLEESIEASRSLTVELSPSVLYDAGLPAALEWLAGWEREKYGLIVHTDLDPSAEPADQDVRVLLFQSVRELLFNVAKHSGTKEAWLTLSREAGGRLRVVVEDAGQGFQPADSRRDGRGTGFGLMSVRERLEVKGGRMDVDAAPGKGTRITLLAPEGSAEPEREEVTEAAEEAAGTEHEPQAEPESAEEAGLPSVRVMVVDDHEAVRDGLVELMSRHPDIEPVGVAEDSEGAVEQARQLRPDVVLMDVSLPGVGGVEATRRIRQELPATQVIGLSMYEQSEKAAAMRSAGAADYLSKATPPDELIERVRQCARGADRVA
ncbi:MAG: PAS domain S-box protein [Phycisphaeraceae bacterium]